MYFSLNVLKKTQNVSINKKIILLFANYVLKRVFGSRAFLVEVFRTQTTQHLAITIRMVVEVLTIHTQDIHKVDQTIHFQDQTIHFQAIQMVDPIILFPDSLIMVVIWIFPRVKFIPNPQYLKTVFYLCI